MNDQNQNNTSTQTGGQDPDQRLDLTFTRSTREIAAAALVGAVIAVITLLILYFSFRGDVANYSKQIEALDTKMTAQVSTLRTDLKDSVAEVEKKIENIADLPGQVRRQILMDMVREMGARTEFLRSQIDDRDVVKKLDELRSTLDQVEQSMMAGPESEQ